MDEEARKTFEAKLKTVGFDEAELETLADGTLFIPMDGPSDAGELPSIVGDDLELKHPLGQGGMGIVNLARQRAMAREVAVKRVLPERKGAEQELLIEARVMGNLEHPNVVPVYSLGTNERGEVLFVMKRISGTAWSDRLRHGDGDLERELRVFLEVCQALHYAHERGLLHRDLKPSNVMLGNFGEVYVLDWGLAVSIGDRPPPGVPHAREVKSVAGTPHYMAPEMAVPAGELDRRTDVYLLGAVLHELLTGRPPHEGEDLVELLHAAFQSRPPALEGVDEEIAEICRRALAQDKDARYPTAAALGEAVQGYLSHAAARQLIERADERLAIVRDAPDDEEGDLAAQRAFDEARFAFGHALETWPEARSAVEGRRELKMAMAERELRRGRARNASVILKGEGDIPDALVKRVEDARAAEERDKARGEKLAFNTDLAVGATTRSIPLAIMGLCWGVMMVVLYARDGASPPYAPILVFQWLALTVQVLGLLFFRDRIIGNKVSWQLAMIVFGGAVTTTGIWTFAWYEAWPVARGIIVVHALLGLGASAAANIDRRMWPVWVLQTFAVFSAVFLREHAVLLSGIFGGVSLILIGWIRGRPSS